MTRYGKVKKLKFNGKLSTKYYVRTNRNGKYSWKCTGQTSLKVAEIQVEKWQTEAITGQKEIPEFIFSDIVDEWYEIKAVHLSPKTKTNYLSYCRQYKRVLGTLEVNKIEPIEIENYFAQRRLEGLGGVSLNNERRYLKSLFAWCVKHKRVTENPVQIKKFVENKRHIPILTPEQEKELIENAFKISTGCGGLVLTAIFTGFRREMLAHILWKHINQDDNTWEIPAALIKSREDFYGRPIHKRVLTFLEGKKQTKNPVFGPFLRREWDTVKTMTPGCSKIRFHDLRKQFVFKCRRAGIPLEVSM